jgi:hypothetical protein
MKTTTLAMAIAAVLAMAPIASTAATGMTKDEYKSSKDKIVADYKAAKASCGTLAGNAKDICMAEAKGNEKVAKAELEARHTGKEKDQYDLRKAKADAAYDVAKEKCDDKSGNDKDVCVKQAKADHAKAKSDAKLRKTVAKATKDSIEDRTEADYKVAAEKCDVLAGDAKKSCISAAKAKYNKA